MTVSNLNLTTYTLNYEKLKLCYSMSKNHLKLPETQMLIQWIIHPIFDGFWPCFKNKTSTHTTYAVLWIFQTRSVKMLSRVYMRESHISDECLFNKVICRFRTLDVHMKLILLTNRSVLVQYNYVFIKLSIN